MTIQQLKEAHLDVGSTVPNSATQVSLRYAIDELKVVKDEICKDVMEHKPVSISELFNEMLYQFDKRINELTSHLR